MSSTIKASKLVGAWPHSPWGRTLYVQSVNTQATDLNQTGLDPRHPLATLVKALAQAQAGDRIIVGPGHVETIASAAALDIDLAGLRIYGVGEGSLRPTISMGTLTTAYVEISANNVLMENFIFACALDSVAKLVLISGDDATLRNCRIQHTGAVQALLGVSVTGDRCHIEGLSALQSTAGAAACVQIIGDDWVVKDCQILGDYSVACISNTAASAGVLVTNNHLDSLNATVVCIDMNATSTGFISHNNCRILTDGEVTWIDGGDCALFENYGVNADAETGMICGTVSAT